MHPVVDYNYIVGAPVLGGELSFTGHARAMTRNDGGTDSTHALMEANWRRKFIDPVGQVWTPFLNARGDVYNYSDALSPATTVPTPIPSDTVLRGTLPPACFIHIRLLLTRPRHRTSSHRRRR